MVDSLGTIYIKKPFHITAGNDGIEEALAGVLLPPYVIPSRWWLKTRIITAGTAPAQDGMEIQPYTISGRVGDFPRDFVTDANPPSAGLQLLTDLMEEFLPHEPASVGDNVQDTQVDVNLPGTSVIGVTSQEFWRRDKWLGLPRNALLVDADVIRYVDYFSVKGTIPNRMIGRYDQGTMLAFGLTTNGFEVQAESDDSLLGAAANASPQLDNILTEILDQIEQNTAGDTPVLFETGMGGATRFNTQVMNWKTAAYGIDVSGDASIRANSVLTVQVDVRIPQYSEHFVARG